MWVKKVLKLLYNGFMDAKNGSIFLKLIYSLDFLQEIFLIMKLQLKKQAYGYLNYRHFPNYVSNYAMKTHLLIRKIIVLHLFIRI